MDIHVAWRYCTLTLAAVTAFALIANWVTVLPTVCVPVIVGAWVGVSLRRPVHALLLGFTSGLLGGLVASWYGTLLQQQLIAINDWFYLEFAANVVDVAPWIGTQRWVHVLAAACVFSLVSFAVSALLPHLGATSRAKTIVAWVTVAFLTACLVSTALTMSGGMRRSVAVEPRPGEYGHDTRIYIKTFYLMERGTDYYTALVEAVAGDSRVQSERGVRGGKFFGWAQSPAYVRMPFLFWLWTLLGRRASSIVVVSVLCGSLLLPTLYGAFARHISTRALLIPILLYPWVLAHSATWNVFFPDWWAALAVMYAVALMAMSAPVPAMLAALLGALFRFNALTMLVCVVAASFLLLLTAGSRRRHFTRLALLGTGLLALFAGVWLVHSRIAVRLIDPSVLASARGAGVWRTNASRPFFDRAVAPSLYMMYAYTHYLVWSWSLAAFPAAALGYVLALRREALALWTLILYVLAWLAFIVLVGPISTYWGQLYTGVLLIGCAALVATLDRLPRLLAGWGRQALLRLA